MVPDTTQIELRDGIVHWTNTEFHIELEEAEAICDEVRRLLDRHDVEGILVDNEEASGTWPTEIDEVWGDLMADIYGRGIDCATVCPSRTNAMHVNKLSKDNGTYDRIRAYTADEREDALAFVGTPDRAMA